jgi:hypothetical protein
MGKKRRLRHSKKFALKHDNHPRMKLLHKVQSEEVVENVVEVATPPTLTAPPPEIVPEVVVETTPSAPKPKVRKTTPTRRKATKKTTSTRKRSTKTKTKTATA